MSPTTGLNFEAALVTFGEREEEETWVLNLCRRNHVIRRPMRDRVHNSLAIFPVPVTVQAMVGWSPPVIIQCFGLKSNGLTNVLWLGMDPSHLHRPKNVQQDVEHVPTSAGHSDWLFRRAAFPDHCACGRASIALRRPTKSARFVQPAR